MWIIYQKQFVKENFIGVAASAFGSLIYDLRIWVARIGGIVVIVFGLHMTGVFRITFLEYDIRVHAHPDLKRGYIASFLMGVFFSAGWSPCIGPVLGSILTLAIGGDSVASGVALLTSYSAGLAIPFLIAALSIGWLSGLLRRYGKVTHYIEVGMGVVLVIVGLMLFFNVFQSIATYGQFLWIDIWVTWCPPCREEMPSMEKLYQELKGNDFEILAVSIDASGATAVAPFIKKYKLSFPALLDPEGTIKNLYGTTGVPESFVIGKDGIIEKIVIGPMDWSTPEVVRFFRNLIQKP